MNIPAGIGFGTAVILLVTGIVALRKVKQPRLTVFAFIPFLLAVQQLAEGCLWLSNTEQISAEWQKPLALLVLLFAHVSFPLWASFALLLPETDRARRKWLKYTLTLGGV